MKKARLLAYILVICALLSACSKSPEQQIEEQLELGQKYLLEENYEQAIVAFTKVIELDSKLVSAYVGRGDAYATWAKVSDEEDALEKYQSAAIDYETALGLEETEELIERVTELYIQLADSYIKKDTEQARIYLEKAYQWNQDEMLFIRIQALLNGGEYLDEKNDVYDVFGKKKKSIRYVQDKSGELLYYIEEKYDEAGKAIKWMSYAPDDSVISEFDYQYNELGQRVQTITWNSNTGKISGYGDCTYDKNGFQVLIQWYDSDGKKDWSHHSFYNSERQCIRSEDRDSDDSLICYRENS